MDIRPAAFSGFSPSVALVTKDELGRVRHPICGHFEHEDRIVPSGPCYRCLKQIEKDYLSDQPHPHCGCLRPHWSFRKDGPCGWCLKDIDREYGIFRDPAINKPKASVDDFRKWRAPLLEATDWVDMNPKRASRSKKSYVDAIVAFRQNLLDGTKNYDGGDMPKIPDEKDFA